MVKAKEFLSFLCEDLGYKYFAGVVCEDLLPLYSSMDPKVMHYVPANNELTSLGLVLGSCMVGNKSVALFSEYGIYDLLRIKDGFCKDYKKDFLAIISTRNIKDLNKKLKALGIKVVVLDDDFSKKAKLFGEGSVILIEKGVWDD